MGKHTNKTSTEKSHICSWTFDTWLFSHLVLQTWDFHIKVICGLASTFWTIIEWSGNINWCKINQLYRRVFISHLGNTSHFHLPQLGNHIWFYQRFFAISCVRGHTAGTGNFRISCLSISIYNVFVSLQHRNDIYLLRSFFLRGPFPHLQCRSVRWFEGNGLWSKGRSAQPGGNNLCGVSAI